MVCGEILQLPSLKDLKIAAGAEGLNRQIRWIYVAECFEDTRQIVDWLYGGELVFITGRGIKGDTGLLVDLIRKIDRKNVSGLIINVGPYIASIPQEVIDEAERLSLPLFELPWEAKLVVVSQEICRAITLKDMEEKTLDNLLVNILFSSAELDEHIYSRAAYYGYAANEPTCICVADIDHFAQYLKERGITEDSAVVEIKLKIKRFVSQALVAHGKPPILMLRSDSIICMVQGRSDALDALVAAVFDEVRSAAQAAYPGLTLTVGVGNAHTALEAMPDSLEEAEQALKAGKCSRKDGITSFYRDLGVFSLLFNVKDPQVLERFHIETLGSILEYDNANDASLMHTLETFLEAGGNLTEIAEKLFVHKNTLKYRMTKIEEISGYDLKRIADCMKLELALLIGRVLEQGRK